MEVTVFAEAALLLLKLQHQRRRSWSGSQTVSACWVGCLHSRPGPDLPEAVGRLPTDFKL